MRQNYPSDWDERRKKVLQRHMNRCVNCRRVGVPLQVHHIVPVGSGGSHRRSNLVPLCKECHQAVHSDQMAPCIKWYTNGELSGDEFSGHKRLWKRMRDRFGAPRYNPTDEYVYIPLADADSIMEQLQAQTCCSLVCSGLGLGNQPGPVPNPS